jgi:TetR/AcrR family fatty acid metabolism transcriptional regulator
MGTGDDAVTRIRDICRLHLEQVGEDRDLAVILQVELRHSLNFLDVFSRSRLRDYLEIITGVIVQGQNEGAFRADMDPLLAARMVFGVLDQMATDWVLSRRETPLAARADEVAAFVLGALKTARA